MSQTSFHPLKHLASRYLMSTIIQQHDPNYSPVSLARDAHTDKKFALDKEFTCACQAVYDSPRSDLEGKKISDVLPDSFWNTNLALLADHVCVPKMVLCSWDEALPCRFCRHIDGLPDCAAFYQVQPVRARFNRSGILRIRVASWLRWTSRTSHNDPMVKAATQMFTRRTAHSKLI